MWHVNTEDDRACIQHAEVRVCVCVCLCVCACVCIQNITYQSYCVYLVRDFPRPPAFLRGLVSTLREREREGELFWVSEHWGMRAEGRARRKWGIRRIENKQGRMVQRLARTFTSPSRWNPPFPLCPRSYFPLFLYLLTSYIFTNTCFRFPPLLLFSYDLYYDFCSFFFPSLPTPRFAVPLPLWKFNPGLGRLSLFTSLTDMKAKHLSMGPASQSCSNKYRKTSSYIASITGFYSWQWISSLRHTLACMLNTCATSRVRLWCLLCR